MQEANNGKKLYQKIAQVAEPEVMAIVLGGLLAAVIPEILEYQRSQVNSTAAHRNPFFYLYVSGLALALLLLIAFAVYLFTKRPKKEVELKMRISNAFVNALDKSLLNPKPMKEDVR